jgi:hypothetical protein
MKMNTIAKWSAVVLSTATLAALAGTAAADETAACPAKEKQFTGKVDYVNNQEHTVTVNGLVRHRTFQLGNNCSITRWDHAAGTINDLRPGQKVIVGYRDIHGVLAADRVAQDAMRYRGIVKSIDPARRQLAMHTWDHDKTFVLGEDCKVMLHDQPNAALDSVKPGDHVTLVYETPSGSDIVRSIEQTSDSFTGSVVAIDLTHRTVSAQGMFGVKQFGLANNCSIVMNGKLDAPLMDLRPGQRLTISYDEVNGVNVASRIAPAEASRETAAAQANR